MKTNIATVFVLLTTCLYGQSTWTALEDFGGDTRSLPASFTIGTKVYLVGGLRSSTNEPTKQNWRYDAVNDIWEEATEYGGEPIWGAFSFVISNKAYVGTGDTGRPGANNYQSLVYEYDPSSNSWDQKSSFGKRSQGVGFSINGKGYVVWGYENENGDKDESVIEFDPTDGSGGTWTILNTIPNVVGSVVVDGVPGVPFVINGEAYITGGILTSQTWKFTPTTDSWVKTTDVVINPYSGVKIGNTAYLIGQRDQCLAAGNPGCQDWEPVVMKYNTSTGDWIEMESVPNVLPVQASRMFGANPCETMAIIGNSGSGENYHWDSNEFFPTSGPTLLCSSDRGTYSLSNVPAGASVQWESSPNLTILTGQGTSSVLVEGSFIGAGWIKPTISGQCNDAELGEYEIVVPEIPIESEMTFNRTSSYNFSNGRWNVLGVHYGNLGITLDKFRWEWNVPSSIISQSDPMASYINFRPQTTASSIYIRTRACNECDECSDWHGQWFNIRSGSGTPCDDSSGLPCRDDEVEY